MPLAPTETRETCIPTPALYLVSWVNISKSIWDPFFDNIKKEAPTQAESEHFGSHLNVSRTAHFLHGITAEIPFEPSNF